MKTKFLFLVIMTIFFTSCEKKSEVLVMDTGGSDKQEDPLKNKGIGPVKTVKLGPLDVALAKKGKKIFSTKCSACHAIKTRSVGPALIGITKRRSPEWVMNMIVNTNEMVEKDPIVKAMIATYMVKMTYQDISKKDARKILEYFRQIDK
ncbi:MAG: cytochrome c [Bdellovibrionales bacterium]|nr:cytochrome c [Bdellovibrionales bacterium]